MGRHVHYVKTGSHASITSLPQVYPLSPDEGDVVLVVIVVVAMVVVVVVGGCGVGGEQL